MRVNDVKTTRGSMAVFYCIANRLMDGEHTLKNIFELPTLKEKRNQNEKAFIYEVDGKEKYLKYKDYYKEVSKYARALKIALKNVEPNSFIGYKMTNSITWPLGFWGLLMAGYKPLLINPIIDEEGTNKLLKEAGAKAIINENDKCYDILSININKLTIIDDASIESSWADEIAFCTSGTTGDSRIFVYNGEALSHQIYAAFIMPYTSADIMYEGKVRLLAFIPFAHIFGFVAVFLWYTFFKASIVFPRSIAAEDLTHAIKKYRCTHIFAVPLFWDTLATKFKNQVALESEKKQNLIKKVIDYKNGYITKSEARIASKKFVLKTIQKKILGTQIVYCIAGGSSLSEETLKVINGIGYNLYNGYGMTEIGITSVELSPDVKMRNKGSVGKALTDVIYKIKDDELLVKSPYLHVARLINGNRLPSDIDDDGFFSSGDIATIDKDGNVYIKGKKKEVIIGANGENIYPEEIELKFKKIAAINNLAILGIKNNKEEVVTLFINVINQKVEEIKNIENEIKQINETLNISMQVKDYYLALKPLPINASLKIKRHELHDDFIKNPQDFIRLSNGVNVSFDGFDQEEVNKLVDKISTIFANVLSLSKDKIAPNKHFIIDLGGDSFSYMSLIASIEEEFKINIPSEMIGKLNNVNDYALFILKNKQ